MKKTRYMAVDSLLLLLSSSFVQASELKATYCEDLEKQIQLQENHKNPQEFVRFMNNKNYEFDRYKATFRSDSNKLVVDIEDVFDDFNCTGCQVVFLGDDSSVEEFKGLSKLKQIKRFYVSHVEHRKEQILYVFGKDLKQYNSQQFLSKTKRKIKNKENHKTPNPQEFVRFMDKKRHEFEAFSLVFRIDIDSNELVVDVEDVFGDFSCTGCQVVFLGDNSSVEEFKGLSKQDKERRFHLNSDEQTLYVIDKDLKSVEKILYIVDKISQQRGQENNAAKHGSQKILNKPKQKSKVGKNANRTGASCTIL